MNCFNNNAPKLSSSDRIKNKKSQAIFKANVIDFQNRTSGMQTKCNNYNGKIGFYRNGELRNARSYDTFLDLNRGSALCVDGAYKNSPNFNGSFNQLIQRGLDSCSRNISSIKNIKITNGRDSVFNIFNGVKTPTESETLLHDIFRGFPVLKSYNISGKTLRNASSNTLDASYNQIACCGDYDSNFVTFDPENYLFGSDFCPTDMNNINEGPNKYLKYTNASQYVVATGSWTPDGLLMPVVGTIAIAGKNALHPNLTINPDNFTGVGIVEKVCKGEGDVYTVFIKVIYGIIPDPSLLPIYSPALKKKIGKGSGSRGIQIISKLYATRGLLGKDGNYTVIQAGGEPCKKNLMFGNNTEQNYLVSFDPSSKGVRFNIDPKLYTDFNV
jgi:hypothetical protein